MCRNGRQWEEAEVWGEGVLAAVTGVCRNKRQWEEGVWGEGSLLSRQTPPPSLLTMGSSALSSSTSADNAGGRAVRSTGAYN